MSKISIIVPIYNVEKYIEKCIRSIMNQTFKDFEVICIIDGSTDKSEEILESLCKEDKRFKIYKRENKGLLFSRIDGINKASSEYITFVDSDDWIDNDYLEILYNLQLKNSSDITICSLKSVSEDGYAVKKNLILEDKVYKKNDIKENIYKELCKGNKFNNTARQLIKKSLFSELSKINYHISMGEDLEFNLSFFDKANIICTTKYSGYNYRYNPNGISKSVSDKRLLKNFEDETNVYYDLITFIEKNNNNYKRLAYYRFIIQFNTYLMKLSLLSNINFSDYYKIVVTEFENELYLKVKRKIKIQDMKNIKNKKKLFCYLLFFKFKFLYAFLTFFILRKIWKNKERCGKSE